MIEKPVALSCERNQQVILDILKKVVLDTDRNLLEIGSGTGQHAIFMAKAFPNVQWQASDLLENHAGIEMWMDEAKLKNLQGPFLYEAGKTPWLNVEADIVFTANTFHIMAWENVRSLIAQLKAGLKSGARIVIYGPFNYAGKFSSESNAKFEQWLKSEGGHRGIRDFEAIVAAMNESGLSLLEDFDMPANNQILVFKKN